MEYEPIAIEALIGKGAKQLTMDMVGVERVAEYAAEDADVTLRLKHALYPEVEKLGMVELYFNVEEPMIDVLAAMELQGVRINSDKLREYSLVLRELLQRLESEVRTMANEPELNINSSRQLGEVLFGKLRITEKPKMTKSKQFSTEEEYLQGFAHDFPIVGKVLEYRGVRSYFLPMSMRCLSLLTAYLAGFIRHIIRLLRLRVDCLQLIRICRIYLFVIAWVNPSVRPLLPRIKTTCWLLPTTRRLNFALWRTLVAMRR